MKIAWVDCVRCDRTVGPPQHNTARGRRSALRAMAAASWSERSSPSLPLLDLSAGALGDSGVESLLRVLRQRACDSIRYLELVQAEDGSAAGSSPGTGSVAHLDSPFHACQGCAAPCAAAVNFAENLAEPWPQAASTVVSHQPSAIDRAEALASRARSVLESRGVASPIRFSSCPHPWPPPLSQTARLPEAALVQVQGAQPHRARQCEGGKVTAAPAPAVPRPRMASGCVDGLDRRLLACELEHVGDELSRLMRGSEPQKGSDGRAGTLGRGGADARAMRTSEMREVPATLDHASRQRAAEQHACIARKSELSRPEGAVHHQAASPCEVELSRLHGTVEQLTAAAGRERERAEKAEAKAEAALRDAARGACQAAERRADACALRAALVDADVEAAAVYTMQVQERLRWEARETQAAHEASRRLIAVEESATATLAAAQARFEAAEAAAAESARLLQEQSARADSLSVELESARHEMESERQRAEAREAEASSTMVSSPALVESEAAAAASVAHPHDELASATRNALRSGTGNDLQSDATDKVRETAAAPRALSPPQANPALFLVLPPTPFPTGARCANRDATPENARHGRAVPLHTEPSGPLPAGDISQGKNPQGESWQGDTSRVQTLQSESRPCQSWHGEGSRDPGWQGDCLQPQSRRGENLHGESLHGSSWQTEISSLEGQLDASEVRYAGALLSGCILHGWARTATHAFHRWVAYCAPPPLIAPPSIPPPTDAAAGEGSASGERRPVARLAPAVVAEVACVNSPPDVRSASVLRAGRLRGISGSGFWLSPMGGGMLARALWRWVLFVAAEGRRLVVEEASRLRLEMDSVRPHEQFIPIHLSALASSACRRGARPRSLGCFLPPAPRLPCLPFALKHSCNSTTPPHRPSPTGRRSIIALPPPHSPCFLRAHWMGPCSGPRGLTPGPLTVAPLPYCCTCRQQRAKHC